jgi:predicted MFS family arabinose efflux permease
MGRLTTGELSSAIALGFWSGIPAGFVVGRALARLGPLWVVSLGALAVGSGLMLVARIDSLPLAYLSFMLLGGGYPFLATPGISGTLNAYVTERYAAALGVALTGASVGGAFMVPAMNAMTEWIGFADAMTVIGIVVVVSLLSASVLLFSDHRLDDARTVDASPGPSMRSILTSKAFVLALLGSTLALMAQVGFLAHQIPILTEHLPRGEATFGVSVTALAAIAGRFLAGKLAETVAVARLSAMAAGVQGLGFVVLMVSDQAIGLLTGSAVAGFVVGAIVMLPPLLIRHYFGTARYAELYAYTNAGLYVGAGLGPFLVGRVREVEGTYDTALLFLALTQLVSVVVLVIVPRRR